MKEKRDMQQKIKSPLRLEGEIIPPGDKSISHRAVIFNSIGTGAALITNFLPGADCFSTVECMRKLGVKIEVEEKVNFSPSLRVEGKGSQGLREPGDILDAGNSGTSMRLLSGLLAAQPFFSVITGDESLRSRPMGRVIKPLGLMGAGIWGRGNNSFAPLAIQGGRLKGISYELPVASAQLKSALILAALYADGTTILTEPAPSRDHTEGMLAAMGVILNRKGSKLSITPLSRPPVCLDINIPGDISSAAFWLVAGLLHPRATVKIKNCGLNPTRTGILDVLKSMGASLEILSEREEGGERVGEILVRSSQLKSTIIEGEMIPRLIDELPVIAVAATQAQGTTIIRNAEELRVKESDRIGTTVRELSKMGADIKAQPDGMIIKGKSILTGSLVDSYKDHRLAMSLAVAALAAQGETIIDNSEYVDISYPLFWQEFRKLCR